MESSRDLVSTIGRPNFIYKHDHFVRILEATPSPSVTVSWAESHLNPKNRINSLAISSTWRIDGSTMCGTRFFATPTSLLSDLPPLRIDVYIPDQRAHPSHLREVLDSSRSVALRHGDTIANLGISRHLCLALDSYCTRHPDFLGHYSQLPFGSRIVFETIKADVTQMEIFTEAAHALEKASLSFPSLSRLYRDVIPVENWPGTMDITSLRLIKQLHDSVSIVRIVVTGEEVIFKSNTGDFNHLYHEMKTLLTISPHPNIISRPLRIITKRSRFGGKVGVIGFTLPYYPLGSIRDIIPLRLLSPDPSNTSSKVFKQSLKWAHQVTSSLHHIYTSTTSQTFYSDLRPDNILLSESGDLILCDFEQRGNWHEWLPPEILYRQYIENLRSNLPSSDLDYADRWTPLISASLSTSFINNTYTNTYPLNTPRTKHHEIDPSEAVFAANAPWFTLTHPHQERAMIYALGIFMYCLFEGLSNPRNSIANAFPFEGFSDVEFPEFRRTPEVMRDIIRRCTGDGMGLKKKWGRRVMRVRGRLVCERWGDEGDGEDEMDGNDVDAARKVLNTGMQWWEGELAKAEAFLEGEEWPSGKFGEQRPTLRDLLDMIGRIQVDSNKVCDSTFGHEQES